MADTLILGSSSFKRRNILAVWLGLPLLTLGIYHYVWIYKVNDEARRYLGDDSIRPGMSVLAFIPGFLLIVPPFVAIYRLGTRIAKMEMAAGLPTRVEPVLGLLLSFVWGAHALYYQSHLNAIWDRYLQPAPGAPPAPLAPPSPGVTIAGPSPAAPALPLPPPPSGA